jgi:mannose-1-phosphate guanylyltransferase
MLEETVARVMPLIPKERILVVTGKSLAKPIASKCPQLLTENIVVEPLGRNTAPAIGLAAIMLQAQDPQAMMAVLSADHQISPQEEFLKALSTAAQWAQKEDWLVTFGISPTRPETGYGYIEVGEMLEEKEGGAIYRVKEFKEKPSRMVAQKFYLDRDHLWNSGMFVWKVETVLRAMATHMPDLSRGLQRVAGKKNKGERDVAIRDLYKKTTSVSIDYGIMEKADNVVVVKGDFFWDDVGTWTALKRIYKPDRDGNVIIGDGVAMDSFECILAGGDEGVIATLGVSDLIVARHGPCVLVAHASRAQDVRDLVLKLGGKPGLKEYL